MSTGWVEEDATARVVLQQHGGVAKLARFVEADLTPRQVAAMRHRGVLERPRSGWYVDPVLPWQAKCAIRVGGVLACVSAVDSFGLPVPERTHECVHVLVPGNAPRLRHSRDRRHYVVPGEDRSVALHWSAADGTPSGWRTDLVESLLLAADCVPEDWWIAALDAALVRPRTGVPILSDAAWSALRERSPSRLTRALALVDPRSESCIETLLRLELLRQGIPIVDLQFWPNRYFRVDLLLPGRLIVEVDGAATHDAVEDAQRDAVLRGLGYRVLRFSYERIVRDMPQVIAEIRAALSVS